MPHYQDSATHLLSPKLFALIASANEGDQSSAEAVIQTEIHNLVQSTLYPQAQP